MTGRSRPAWIAAAVTAVLVVPLGTGSSLASWTDTELAHASIRTTEFDCGTQSGYTATASARQVQGTLLGLDLDTVSGVRGIETRVDGAGNAAYAPAETAIVYDDGSGWLHTAVTSLNLGLVEGTAGVSLPQIATGLPGLDAGALAQYAQVREHGAATGATGLVSDQSGIVAIGSTSGAAPEDARVGLATLLPGIENLSDVGLEIGAASAMSQVDGCALLAQELWSIDPASPPVTRDYEIAGLELVIESPLLRVLVDQVNSTVTTLETGVNGLVGSLAGAIDGALSGLNALNVLGAVTTRSTGAITVETNISESVQPLLTEATSGALTVRPLDGEIIVDLAQVLGGPNGLNDLDPNTELTLDDEVLNSLNAQLGALLSAWTSNVLGALTEAVNATTLRIDRTVAVVLDPPPTCVLVCIDMPPTDVLSVVIATNGPVRLDQFGVGSFTIDVDVLDSLLLGAVLSLITGLASTAVSAALTTTVNDLLHLLVATTIPALGPALTAGTAPIVALLGQVLSPLQEILSLRVNLQPDQPNPPPNPPVPVAATQTSTAEYLVTALRIGAVSGASTLLLDLATASAGPITIPSH